MIAIDRDHPAWCAAIGQDWKAGNKYGNAGLVSLTGGALSATRVKGRRPGLIRAQTAGTVELPGYSLATHGVVSAASTDNAWWTQEPGILTQPGQAGDALVGWGGPSGDSAYPDALAAAMLAYSGRIPGMQGPPRCRYDFAGTHGRVRLYRAHLFSAGSATQSPGPTTPLLYREPPVSVFAGMSDYLHRWSWDPMGETWTNEDDFVGLEGGADFRGSFLRCAFRDPATGAMVFAAVPECGEAMEDTFYISGDGDTGRFEGRALTTPAGYRKARIYAAPVYDYMLTDPDFSDVRTETRLVYHDRFTQIVYGIGERYADNSDAGYAPDTIETCENPFNYQNGFPHNAIMDNGMSDYGWSLAAAAELNYTDVGEWRDIMISIPAGDHIITAGTVLKYTYLGGDYEELYGEAQTLIVPDAAPCPAAIAVRGGGFL